MANLPGEVDPAGAGLDGMRVLQCIEWIRDSDQIVHGSDEAHNNLEFLQFLSDPCTRLASAKPKDISAQLPEIVDLIRMISSLSQHYNTPERIAGLLRKVSNEIILRCSENIKLDEIFAG